MARIFNGGTQPLVPAGRWGDGVVMPGEHIHVDNPETYGPPWTVDNEAADALTRITVAVDDSTSGTDGVDKITTGGTA